MSLAFSWLHGSSRPPRLANLKFTSKGTPVGRTAYTSFRSYSDSANGEPASATIYVGNLPKSAAHHPIIRHVFKRFGDIGFIQLGSEKRGRFALVNFKELDHAKRAVQEHANTQLVIDGRPIEIRYNSALNRVEAFNRPNDTLYVGKLPLEISQETLESLFAPYGPVDRVIVGHKEDGERRDHARVVFNSKSAAKQAMSAYQSKPEDFVIEGRQLLLNYWNSGHTTPRVGNVLEFVHFFGNKADVERALGDQRLKDVDIISLVPPKPWETDGAHKGFIQFKSVKAARNALQALNGTMDEKTRKRIRLSYRATAGGRHSTLNVPRFPIPPSPS